MKKVFYRCIEAFDSGRVMFKLGEECFALDVPLGYRNKFERIERDCFEANGHTWFRHTPGDPMPCFVAGKKLECLWNTGLIEKDGDDPLSPDFSEHPHYWTAGGHEIIGWRYADSAKPEVPQKEPESQSNFPQPLSDGKLWPLGGLTFPSPQENDEMMCADMPLAAMDDGHLTPGQKAYIQALQERAGQLADAGKAMDRVNQDHGHRLGWMQ